MKYISLFIFILSCYTAQAKTADAVSTATIESQESRKIIPFIANTYFKLNGPDSSNSTYQEGAALGVLTATNFGIPKLEFQTGLAWIQTGSKDDVTGLGFFSLGGIKTTLNYISIPIQVKYSLWKPSEVSTVLVSTGLLSSFLMSAKQEAYGLVTLNGDSNIKSNLNNFDVMAQFGIGYEYTINQQLSVVSDVTYLRGLRSITKAGSAKASGFLLAAAVAINI